MNKLISILIIICVAAIGLRLYMAKKDADARRIVSCVSEPVAERPVGSPLSYGAPVTSGGPMPSAHQYIAPKRIDSAFPRGMVKGAPGLWEMLHDYARTHDRRAVSPGAFQSAKKFRAKTGKESLWEFLRACDLPLDNTEPLTGFSMPLPPDADPMQKSFGEYREAVREVRLFDQFVEEQKRKMREKAEADRIKREEENIRARMEVPDTTYTLPADLDSGTRNAYLRGLASDNPLPHSGGAVILGSWPQSGETPEPVEWLIVERLGSRALCVISKYALDSRAFCDGKDVADSWSGSSLRAWLNGEFFDKAFSDSEKRRILTSAVHDVRNTAVRDKVFIPCEEEANVIFGINMRKRVCVPTAHAKAAGIYLFEGSENALWWTRMTGNVIQACSCINHEGFDQPVYANVPTVGVRPMMWISPE